MIPDIPTKKYNPAKKRTLIMGLIYIWDENERSLKEKHDTQCVKYCC